VNGAERNNLAKNCPTRCCRYVESRIVREKVHVSHYPSFVGSETGAIMNAPDFRRAWRAGERYGWDGMRLHPFTKSLFTIFLNECGWVPEG